MFMSIEHFAKLARYIVQTEGESRKIECIKKLRELTGLGLKEAKLLVEADPVMVAFGKLRAGGLLARAEDAGEAA